MLRQPIALPIPLPVNVSETPAQGAAPTQGSGDRPGVHKEPSNLMNPYVGGGIALFHTHYRGAQTFLLTSGGVFLLAGLEFHQPAGRWGAFAEFQMTVRKSLPGFETDSVFTAEAIGTAGVKIRIK